jgi:phage tail sheath protein FI
MATETIVSPGVLLQEIDKSFITPGTDPSGLAIIGPTARGPIEIPTEITNYNSFKEIFGTVIRSGSQAYEYFTNLAVKNYFDNGGASAIVTRVVSGSAGWTAASNTHISASAKLSVQPFTLETIGKGADLNSTGNEYSGGALVNGSKNNFRWEIGNVNNSAGTFTVSIRRGDDTTTAPLVLEQFTNCSLDPLSPNYISKKIGDQSFSNDGTSVNVSGEFENKSNFVRVSAVNLPTYQFLAPNGSVGTDSGNTSYSASLPIAQTGSFQNGAGSNTPSNASASYGSGAGTIDVSGSIQGLDPGDYTNAIAVLKNKDEYKFKTLIAPGLNQEIHSTTIDTIISNTAERGDNLFIADLTPYNSSIATVKGEAEELDTSYAASYWPWIQVRSTELNRNVFCPASTIIPGVFAKNDSIAAPWFAPAGETRGKIGRLGIKVETKLSKAQRDDLYTSKVNPIATFPDTGLVVFGQKTLQQAASALDRVNVRRLLLDVKDTIGGFSEKLVFEQNTQQTRDRFLRQATPYLESLVQRQGLYAFQVKMDGQLNTSDIIDENKLIGQVFLQPTKTAEFIVLDFTITPTGASFTD